MRARILDVREILASVGDPNAMAPELAQCIEQAAQCVISGGVVVFPTETFYGIAVSVERLDALERLFRIKGRDENKPIGLIAGERTDAERVFHVDPSLTPLLETFWPGPLTLVAPPKKDLPMQLTSAPFEIQGVMYPPAVGVRVSSHPIACALAQKSGGLITATSANFAGAQAPRAIAQMDKILCDKVDLVLDAGELGGQKPSTLIRLLTDKLWILRQGAVTQTQLQTVLPQIPVVLG